MNDFFKRLKTIHKANEAEPWLEQEYTDYSDFHYFLWFINAFDNLAHLRQQYEPFLFRGQADAKWTLKPKLVRLLEGMPLEDALRYEFDCVVYFRERAHLFCASLVPEKDNFLEWLCLMQHFSAPTRMLDWTGSFTVALYFAVFEEPIDTPGAIWIVHGGPLWKWMHQKYPEPEFGGDAKAREVCSSYDSFVDFGVNRASLRLDGYDPDRKSERVTAQRGVLTVCERLFVDHATIIGQALLEVPDSEQNLPLWKIVISPEAKRFFRQYLNKLNITAATLFPGTDGLGRTISETLRVLREANE